MRANFGQFKKKKKICRDVLVISWLYLSLNKNVFYNLRCLFVGDIYQNQWKSTKVKQPGILNIPVVFLEAVQYDCYVWVHRIYYCNNSVRFAWINHNKTSWVVLITFLKKYLRYWYSSLIVSLLHTGTNKLRRGAQWTFLTIYYFILVSFIS